MNDSTLNNLIRTGIVQQINPKNCTVRVLFADEDNSVSDELPVIMRGTSRNKDKWLPNLGDTVICLFLPVGLEVGWCLGSYYNDEDLPPDNNPDTEIKQFSDGTKIIYDRKEKQFTINCVGNVKLNCKNLEVTASQSIINGPTKIVGNLEVTGTIAATGSISSTKAVTAPSGSFSSGLTVTSKDWLQHTHGAGSLKAPNGNVSGTTDMGSAVTKSNIIGEN